MSASSHSFYIVDPQHCIVARWFFAAGYKTGLAVVLDKRGSLSVFLSQCESRFGAFHLTLFFTQELSMPDDSFVLTYFKFLNKYLSVGPPFYIVINNTKSLKGKGYDFSDFKLQNRICGGQGCDVDSLQIQVSSWNHLSLNRAHGG